MCQGSDFAAGLPQAGLGSVQRVGRGLWSRVGAQQLCAKWMFRTEPITMKHGIQDMIFKAP